MKNESGRLEFFAACEEFGFNPLTEESALLSIGREFLPPSALAVLDGGEATADYYGWLTEQVNRYEDVEEA
ncbi:MAG TPA: hypothetical protein VII30_04825 [Gemmatimonadaceae bacterium]